MAAVRKTEVTIFSTDTPLTIISIPYRHSIEGPSKGSEASLERALKVYQATLDSPAWNLVSVPRLSQYSVQGNMLGKQLILPFKAPSACSKVTRPGFLDWSNTNIPRMKVTVILTVAQHIAQM